MSAARILEAEKVLRERAQAATPGPWHLDMGGDSGVYTAPRPTVTSADVAFSHQRENEAYIATVHPNVGLVLADWLRWCALYDAFNGRARRIADVILGGGSDG